MTGTAARVGIVVAVLAALALDDLAAQQRGARDLARWLQANQRELQNYSWKVRTEILIGGESMGVRLDEVRYSGDGRLERTPIQAAEVQGDHGPLSRRRSKKKLARAEEQELALGRLIDAYRPMSFEDMRESFSRAFVDQVPGGDYGEIRVQVHDLVHRGDSMTLWLDGDRLPTRLEVFTALDGEPVRMTAEYVALEGGPSVVVRSVVETESGEKKLVIRSESFDFAADDGS